MNADLAAARMADQAQKRDAIITETQTWLGTPYLYGGDSKSGVDCSHFVYEVLKAAAVPQLPYMDTALLHQSQLFITVTIPQKGDLILWDGHVALVKDPTAGTFVGAQTSTGVAESNYLTNPYWSARAGRMFRRLAVLY